MGLDHHWLPDERRGPSPSPACVGARLIDRRLFVALALAVSMGGQATAQTSEYQFEAVDPYPRREVGVILRVRLRDTDGRLQPGATILEASLDKSPDGQPGAYASVTVLPTQDYGVYAFKTDLNTDGRYALYIRARLPGVSQPVSGSVIFTTPAPKQTLPSAAAPTKSARNPRT